MPCSKRVSGSDISNAFLPAALLDDCVGDVVEPKGGPDFYASLGVTRISPLLAG